MKAIVSIAFLFALTIQSNADVSCTKISDDQSRLKCYDAKHRPITSAKTLSVWRITNQKSQIDDSKSIFMTVRAKQSYSGSHGRIHTPVLTLRCMENTTAVIINSDGDYLSDHSYTPKTVLRVDKKKARKFRMATSTDNKAIGFWRGGTAIPFIKSMFGGNELLVQYTPVSDSPQTFKFPISGLETSISDLRRTCKW